MEISDFGKLVGGGGIAAALLYLLYLVGMRVVGALDRVAVKIDDVRADNADNRAAIVRMDTKLDVALAGLGIEPAPQAAPQVQPTDVRRNTPARGIATGFYSHVRPGTGGA